MNTKAKVTGKSRREIRHAKQQRQQLCGEQFGDWGVLLFWR